MLRRKKRRNIGVAPVYIVIFLLAVAVALIAKPNDILRTYDVSYVVIDLKKEDCKVVPVRANCPGGESVESLIARTNPVAAVAGTYFDDDFKPLGDLVCDGKVISRGRQRPAMGFKEDGSIVFLQKVNGRKLRWNGIESGVACGPRLLKDGDIDLDCKRDGFSEAANRLLATRCAIGRDGKGRLIMCAVPSRIKLKTLAEIMLRLGAEDAINLDGGRSCFLYADSKIQQQTGCTMSNIITVQKR